MTRTMNPLQFHDTDTVSVSPEGDDCMGRHKSEPTAVQRIRMEDARKINYIRKRLGIKFRDAFARIAGDRLDDIYRRMKAGEHIELGEAGA